MSQDKKHESARAIVNLIANSKLGLISLIAKKSITESEQSQFLEELHQQLKVDDPESTFKILGEEISDMIIKHFDE